MTKEEKIAYGWIKEMQDAGLSPRQMIRVFDMAKIKFIAIRLEKDFVSMPEGIYESKDGVLKICIGTPIGNGQFRYYAPKDDV